MKSSIASLTRASFLGAKLRQKSTRFVGEFISPHFAETGGEKEKMGAAVEQTKNF